MLSNEQHFVLTDIDVNIKDVRGKSALEIVQEHPAQKSKEIAILIQGTKPLFLVIS